MNGRFRWTRILALIAVVAIVGAACSKNNNGGTASSPPGGATSAAATSGAASSAPAAAPLKVAIVAPSATNDLAFTQSMVDAVNGLKDSENLDVSISDNQFVVDDAANAIRNYASQGFDLVIAHGSQYGGSVQQIAPQFPNVSFAWGTAGDTFGLDNVYAYSASSDEGGYVMGTMAAAMSTSKILGVIGPIEVGDAQLYVDGFKAGAAAADPSVKTKVNYTGSFSDVGLAAEAARSFLAANADVMTGTAQMVVGAIGVCKQNNIPWFGTQANQTSLAPAVVVASQVYHWEVVLKQMIDGIRAGKLGGQSFDINLKNQGEVIEYNTAFSLPADVKAKGDAATQGIIDGSIDTGVKASG
jgi:basic membrane lipoprotein Med (substrate-binding protein (PBP1-ABC) superfamily)